MNTSHEQPGPGDNTVRITWAEYLDLLLEGQERAENYEVIDVPPEGARVHGVGGERTRAQRDLWQSSPVVRRAYFTRELLARLKLVRLPRRVREADLSTMSEAQLRNLLSTANRVLEQRLLDEQEKWTDEQWKATVETLRLSRDKQERVQAAAKRRKALAAAGGAKAVQEDVNRRRTYAQLRRRQRAASEKS